MLRLREQVQGLSKHFVVIIQVSHKVQSDFQNRRKNPNRSKTINSHHKNNPRATWRQKSIL